MWNENSILEKICNLIVFVIMGLFVSAFFMSLFCTGWNEGSMAGTCSPEYLTSLYRGLMGYTLVLAFSGFIWIWFVVIGIMFQVKKIKNLGFKNYIFQNRMMTILYFFPLLLVVFFFLNLILIPFYPLLF